MLTQLRRMCDLKQPATARAWWSTVCPSCGQRLLDRPDGATYFVETVEECHCSEPAHAITVRWCRGCYERHKLD